MRPAGARPVGLRSGGCAALPTGYLHARLRRERLPVRSTENSEEPKGTERRDGTPGESRGSRPGSTRGAGALPIAAGLAHEFPSYVRGELFLDRTILG